MEIEIPSPTAFLRPSPITSPLLPIPVAKPEPSAKIRSLSNTKLPSKSKPIPPVTQNGIVKPKQSKSRNGCMTCKKKRLKCDETKPTCEQCRRRNVDCEGYKKDFKWRTFEETTQNSRAAKAKKSGTVDNSFEQEDLTQGEHVSSTSISAIPRAPSADDLQDAFASAAVALRSSPPRSPNKSQEASSSRRRTPPEFAPLPILDPALSPSQFELPSPTISPLRGLKPRENGQQAVARRGSGSPSFSRTNDLVFLGRNRQSDVRTSQMSASGSPNMQNQVLLTDDPVDDFQLGSDTDVQDIIQEADMAGLSEATQAHWNLGPNVSSNVSSAPNSPHSPSLEASLFQAEDLMQIYDLQTCGILSVKDSPGENPWRTIIWPLTRECEPMYYAVNAMTAMHTATSFPDMRMVGITRVAQATSKLSAQIGTLRLDESLATSLVLAVADSWDEGVSTGIQHLHGAKMLVNTAMTHVRSQAQAATLSPVEVMRLKFLCNTFIYREVIARLTSLVELPRNPDVEDVLYTFNDFSGNSVLEVDPLMGCAGELFPKIGRAAQLIQEARRRPNNSLTIVARANEIREDLMSWQPPHVQFVERPEDPLSDVTHAVHTAEAYRIATLLYLHQTVPEMVMEESAHSLAKTILTLLAGVPLSSRTMIVQIFPLFVGSCEMTADEDREWVSSRWLSMMQRMDTVNVKSCWEIVQDVWSRRDAFEATKHNRRPKSGFQMSDRSTGFMRPSLVRSRHSQDGADEDFAFDLDDMSPHMFGGGSAAARRRRTFESFGTTNKDLMPLMQRRGPANKIEPEFNIRGRLHWLSAMTERGWEVFLG